ncbi:hypothetical protein HPB49_002981 [Dermacentor silvarum]|uniref:Uncharacterized protein n=1 Tax=Dermacentor silvarum TaxID=543639 RepID=A0ACB8CVB7_DERSI|nr:hypothetical protein HPB49_002981 [Dermacentor silvarum]
MPTCFAPGCTSGYRSNTQKRHFFAPPSDPQLLSKGKRAIPRVDKELSKTSKICDVHFLEADISKTLKHIINGEVVEIDRAYWALKEAQPVTAAPWWRESRQAAFSPWARRGDTELKKYL